MNRRELWDELMCAIQSSTAFLYESFEYTIDSFHKFADSLARADEIWEQRRAAFLEQVLEDNPE